MNKAGKTARVAGCLILAAYAILGSNHPDAKVVGMRLETISGYAVIAIAVLMFPYLKPYGGKSSLIYLGSKSLEGFLMIVVGSLFLIHTPQLLDISDKIYLAHGYIFAVPALTFYGLLFKSKLVPGWLSVWGMIAAILLIIANFLEATGTIPLMGILYLPIILNEIGLALWLMVRGFNTSAPKTKPKEACL